jgi:hypothetical protein
MKHATSRQTVRALAGSAAVVAGLSLNAQAPAQSTTPTFEAASVKPNKSGDPNSMRNLGAGGRMVFANNSLRQLITAAYDIQPFQLIAALRGSAPIVSTSLRPPAPTLRRRS